MKKLLVLLLCVYFVLCLTSCEKVDYSKETTKPGGETNQDADNSSQVKTEIVVPQIKSDDTVMPTYFDISLYDEENYADIYLGKDFDVKLTYCGESLSLPTTYQNMIDAGWSLSDLQEYNSDSQVLVGKSVTVNFTNSDNKILTAVFVNDKKSSDKLKNCKIVTLKIMENSIVKTDSNYGSFSVNGVGNESAITDVIDSLGSPSHFYCVSEDKYYLDWFLDKSDRRNEIKIYVDTAYDQIDAIEISHY